MAQRDPKNKERKKSPITTARTTLQALTSRDTLFKLHVFCLITLLTALSVDSCVPSFRESDLRYRYVYRHFSRLDLGGMQPGRQNSQQQIASHLSLHIIFLVHDTCPRDHKLQGLTSSAAANVKIQFKLPCLYDKIIGTVLLKKINSCYQISKLK